MDYAGAERRKFPRYNCHFMVSYCPVEGGSKADISSMKNLSLGGVLLTTARPFETGTNLALKIRLPLSSYVAMPTARVIESSPVARGLIYNTRLEFANIDEHDKQLINETLHSCLPPQNSF